MKAFFKVLAISLFVVFGGIFTIVGCQNSPASKVKGSISESEITVYFDEVDGDTVKNFDVALSGIGKMSNKIVFNFENTEVANISLVSTEGNTSTFAVTAKNGGSTNVAVVHQDTNKTIGNIKINAVRKLQSLTLKSNIIPHAVVNEETYLRAIDLVSLNPYNTTQTAVGFRLKDQTQNATISLDGKLLVTRKPSTGYINVLAYSLNNSEVSPVEINVEVVEKPVLENLTIYNLNNDAEKVFNQGTTYPIVLVGNYPSKSTISLRAQYFGDTNVNIVFEKAENSNLDIIKLNSNEYEILSNSAERTNFTVKIVNQKFSDVYSEVTIPVKVIDAPTKVFVNGQSEDSTLNVYSSYIGSKGLKLRVGVDIVDMTTSANNEIKLAVGQNRNSFKFFYEDGQTEIDIDNAVLPNNSIIYVLADDQAINNGNNTAVLSVEAYRAYEAGLSVVNNVTLIGRKGANEIALNIPNNQEEIYVKNGNTATIAYSLNSGAYAENITVESNNNSIADFSVDTYARTINITGKRQGLAYITLTTENGVSSNSIPVRVYAPLEKEQVLIKVESAEQNLYLSEIKYNLDNSLERLVIVAKHGTYINLTSNSNGTILSSEFTSNNNAVTINSMGYIFANAVSDNTTITVNYKTLKFTANDGTAEVVNGSKTFTVVSYTAIKNLDIVNENNQSIYNVSLLSSDNYLDLAHYNSGDYAYNLKLNINPTNAPYEEDGIKWEITENDYIKLIKDSSNPFAVRVISENYNNYSTSFSATIYATVRQFGKTYTRACVVTTKSQSPVTMVNISTNEVYFDFSNGSAKSQEITVSVNKDALNKIISVNNFYSYVESAVKKNEDNSYTITLTPKEAGVAILNLNVDGLNLVNGYNRLPGLNTQIKVIVADGKTEETALYVNDQKDFITMLENQSKTTSDSDFKYYKLNKDIVLMQDLTQYSTFNGSFSSVEGRHYSIRNINVKNGNNNVALFKNLNKAVISDIDFYFNDISTNEKTFACLANSATKVNLNDVGVFVNNVNIDAQENNEYNIAGVIAKIENPQLNNVKFGGNININSATSITLNQLYAGQISASVGSASEDYKFLSSDNENFSNASSNESVKGNIYVSEKISATTSGIGGLVGTAINTNIYNYHVNVNINAQKMNNVGGIAGYVKNGKVNQNLTAGFVRGNENVGGLVGQLINSSAIQNIVEFRLSNIVSIDQNNEFVYVGAQTNVGGFIGLVNNTSNDSTIKISQNYITAYFDYASVRGKTNVGGFIGNILGKTVISKSYAKTLVSANEGNDNVGGFIGNLDAGNTSIENAFFIGKNKANSKFIGATNQVEIKTSYAIVYIENGVSLYLYNNQGNSVDNISLSDLTETATFTSAGFSIISETINDETIWYISGEYGNEYNNKYPILVINGIVAEKNVSIEKLEDALNNFNNLQDDKFISKGTLSTLDSYYVIGNNQDYILNDLFKLEGIDLDFSLIENETSNVLDKTSNSPTLTLSEEGVLKLRLSVKQNSSVYKDVFIVSINDFNTISFKDNENSESNLENNTLEINKGQSKNLIATIGSSKIALIAYENQDYSNFTINGLLKYKVIGVDNNLFVSSTNINTVNAIKETNDGDAVVNYYVVVNINGEYVKLYPKLQDSTNSNNFKVSIKSIATDMTVSVTDITMTMLDEFNFEVVVNNTSNTTDEVIISAEEKENILKFNEQEIKDADGNDVNIISINGNASGSALLILEKVSAETNKTNNAETSSTNSSVTYKYHLRINDKYLNPNNIISFDAFTLNLKFSSKSNNNLSKTISISLSMQDLLHTSFKYYPKAIRTVEDNVTSYILLENGSNKIMPGETGILTIDMYPTYSNFDEMYITAVAENGASIVLSQKALLTQTNNSVTIQNFVSVKPNTALVENGLYLRKLSTVTTADTNKQTETDYSYNGTLYVMLYVPKATEANIKYTFNVTTYRLKDNGSIDEESLQVSKPFYLYTGLVPSIKVEDESLGQVVVKNTKNEFVTYRPLVIGVEKVLNIKTTNFIGTPKVIASGLNAGIGEDGKLYLATKDDVKAGDTFKVIVTISQNVDGVFIEDSYTLDLIAVDFYIKDIFVSTDKESTTFNQTLTAQYTLVNNLYLRYDVDIDSSSEDAKSKFAETINKIFGDNNGNVFLSTDYDINIGLTKINDYYTIKPNVTGIIKNALHSQLYYYYYYNTENTENKNAFTFEITNNSSSGQANEICHDYNVNSIISTSVDEALAISSAEEFMNMQEGVNYILADNITLTNYNNAIDFNASSLNGNFYTVTINTLTADENGNVGFFKTIKEGSFIKNLTVNITQNNLVINANSLNQINVGLFAIENNGAIYNCKVISNDEPNKPNKPINVTVKYDENESIQYPNQQIDIAGFVTRNSSTGFITNSSISDLTIKTKLKANIAGFVVDNDGKIAKNKVTNLIVGSYDDESIVAGFVVNNTNNAQILQSFVDNNYQNSSPSTIDTDSQSGDLLGYGIVSGFVYKNDGLVQSCYTDLTTSTNYRSAGFVFDNTGKVIQCNALANVNNVTTGSETQTSGFSKSNTPFTGTNENNEVNNTGSIEYCYYKSNEQDLETYKDILFDEPASYIVDASYNQDTFKGFDIGNSNLNYKTWYWNSAINKPILTFGDIDKSKAEVIEGIVQKVNEQEIGKSKSTPVTIYSAKKLLNVLTDALYLDSEDENIVSVNMQLVCDIDMEEVANDEALAQIQNKTFVGSFDGNGFTIKNLSVLTASTTVQSATHFGFFKQVGESEKNISNISNLTINVKEMSSSNANKVGVLAGELANVHISNVKLDGEGIVVSGRNSVGALAGYASIIDNSKNRDNSNNDNNANSTIDLFNISSNISVSAGYDSYNAESKVSTLFVKNNNNNNINNVSYAGGIIGILDSTAQKLDDGTALANVSNILVYGKVNVTADFAGGVFGYNNTYVYNVKFEVDETKDSQYIKGNYCAGGIIAHNGVNSVAKAIRVEVNDLLASNYDKTDYEYNKKVDTLFLNSKAISDNDEKNLHTTYLGGLIGYNEGTVKVGYNKANVVNKYFTTVGGLIGYVARTSVVKELYLTGKVQGKTNVGVFGQIEAKDTTTSDADTSTSDKNTSTISISKIVNLSTNVIKVFGDNNNELVIKDNYIYTWDGLSREPMKKAGKIETFISFYGKENGNDSPKEAVFNWKQINTKISYYPQIQLTATSNVIKINNKDDFNQYIASGNDTYGKTYIITADITLDDKSYNISSFKGTLRSEANEINTLTFTNQQQELFINLELASIENVNFKFTLSENFKASSVLADSIKMSSIKNCNISITNSSINLVTKNESKYVSMKIDEKVQTVKQTTGTAGLISCYFENSSVSSLKVTLNDNAQVNITCGSAESETSNVTNLWDLKVGTLFGATGKSSSLDFSMVTVDGSNNEVKDPVTLNVITNIAVLNSAYIGGVVGYADNTQIADTTANVKIILNKSDAITESSFNGGDRELYVGGFAGYINSQSINNVTLTTNIDVQNKHPNIKYVFIGGFAGQITSTLAQNVSVTIENIKVKESEHGRVGGFAGQLVSGKYNLVSVKIIDGYIFTQYFGGFTGVDGANSQSKISESGIIIDKIKISPSATSPQNTYIAGFIGYMQNSAIKKCFASVNINIVNTATNIGGFVACVTNVNEKNPSSISNSYVVGKIVSSKCSNSGGFYAVTTSNNPNISNSFTALTIINGLKSDAFYGFGPKTGDKLTNCYYVFNNVGAEHNNVATPVNLDGLKLAIKSNDSTKYIFNTDGVYPSIIYNGSTLESKLFSSIEDGSALKPIVVTESETSLNIADNKYYILSGNYENLTINTGNTTDKEYVIYGYNAKIKKLTGNVVENSYISGITLNVNAIKQYGFVEKNKGSIFNCFVNGTLINSSKMSGFVTTNNGTISHCGVNITFDMNNSLPNVSGFATTNKGIISTSYVVGDVVNYKMEQGSTDIPSTSTNKIVGFINEVSNVEDVKNCYSVLNTLSKTFQMYCFGVGSDSSESCAGPNGNVVITNIRNFVNVTTKVNGKETTTPSLIWGSSKQHNYGYPYLIDYGSSQIEANSMNSLVDTGNGTKDNPYQINNDITLYYHLEKTKSNTNNQDDDMHYKLTQDIDMSIISDLVQNKSYYWQITNAGDFELDGQNHVIYNMEKPLLSFAGVTSSTNVTIKNLGIDGAIDNVVDGNSVGGLITSIGQKRNVTISNCYNNVNITVNSLNNSSQTLENLNVGLFAGSIGANASLTISNSFTIGDITIKGVSGYKIYAGAFVGNSGSSSRFQVEKNSENYSLSSIKIDATTRLNSTVYAYAIEGNQLGLNYKNVLYNLTMSMVGGSSFSESKYDNKFDLSVLILQMAESNETTNGLTKLSYLLKNFSDNKYCVALSKITMSGSKLNPLKLNDLSKTAYTAFLNNKLQGYGYVSGGSFETLKNYDSNIQDKFIFEINSDAIKTATSGTVGKALDYTEVSEEEFNLLTKMYGNEWEYKTVGFIAQNWNKITITNYSDFKNKDFYPDYTYSVSGVTYVRKFKGTVRKLGTYSYTPSYSSSATRKGMSNFVLSNLTLITGFKDSENPNIANSGSDGFIINLKVTNPSNKLFNSLNNVVLDNCSIEENSQGFSNSAGNSIFMNCKSSINFKEEKTLSGAMFVTSADNETTLRFENCSYEITANTQIVISDFGGFIGSATSSNINLNNCKGVIDITESQLSFIGSNIQIGGFVKLSTNSEISIQDSSLNANIDISNTPESIGVQTDKRTITFGGVIGSMKGGSLTSSDFTLSGTQTFDAYRINYGGIVASAESVTSDTIDKPGINIASNNTEMDLSKLSKVTLNAKCDYGNIGGFIGQAVASSTIALKEGVNNYNFETILNVTKKLHNTAIANNEYLNIGGYIGALGGSSFDVNGLQLQNNNGKRWLGNEIHLTDALGLKNQKWDNTTINLGGCVGYVYSEGKFNLNINNAVTNEKPLILKEITATLENSSANKQGDNGETIYSGRLNLGGLVGQLSNSQFNITYNVLLTKTIKNSGITYKGASEKNYQAKTYIGAVAGYMENNSTLTASNYQKDDQLTLEGEINSMYGGWYGGIVGKANTGCSKNGFDNSVKDQTE